MTIRILQALTFSMALPALIAQNSWTRTAGIPIRDRSAAVWDSVRERVVVQTNVAGTSGETLEWNGSSWATRQPANSPGYSNAPELVFDAARGETLRFGGFSFSAETWTWNGHDWTQRSPATVPAARTFHALAYDPIRERVVLFGGTGPASGQRRNDTWEWDGVDWSLVPSANAPSPRSSSHMTWDPASQRVLLFGGQDSSGRNTDTWAWDGVDWTALSPAASPPATTLVQLATDPVRGFVVGYFWNGSFRSGETWLWDGVNWALVPTTNTPNAPNSALLAYDGNTGGVLAAFGQVRSGIVGIETRTFDGVDWSLVDAQPKPFAARLVTDTTRNRVLMYSNMLDDSFALWEWGGDRWIARDPMPAPPARLFNGVFAHDDARGRTVQFGGRLDFTQAYSNDTWEWDGTTWTLMQPTNRPPASPVSAAGYDAARGVVVAYFGSNLQETWIWNGVDWTRPAPTTTPSAIPSAGMVFDPVRQKLVMVGRVVGVATMETWEWDGVDWSRSVTPNAPPAQASCPLAYDPVRGRILAISNNETWSYDGVDWTLEQSPTSATLIGIAWDPIRERMIGAERGKAATWVLGPGMPAAVEEFGAGCAGTRGVPALAPRGLPQAANPEFALELVSGRPNSAAVIQLMPGAAGTAIPFGSCTLLAAGAGNLVASLGSTNSGGFAELVVPIPPMTTLFGLTFVGQGIVLDPSGAGLGWIAATAGLRLSLGD